MDEKSVLLLNYGLPYLDRLSFSSYKKMTDIVARTLDGYKGQVVWRTTSSLQKPSSDVFKSFETFQVMQIYTASVHLAFDDEFHWSANRNKIPSSITYIL